MAEADCNKNESDTEEKTQDEEIISPMEEIAFRKSERMRRVRWSEDLEEIRYFSAKHKKEKRRISFDSLSEQFRKTAIYNGGRRFSDLPLSTIGKFKVWLDDKDFKSDVVLLGLKMKSAFKKADFYDTEKDWENDDVFTADVKNVKLNGIQRKR